jgi:hypothetical protein|tara:strand:- start:351 stop:533 length:183 start_codon:yes stop_codon:yes gene_type:complete
MHDFKPGDLVRTAWTREKGVVVEHTTRNESWKQIFLRVHWFDRGATTQVRASVIRHLEEE